MQTKLNKSKKIIKETKKEHKANKTGFAILSLSCKKNSTINHILDSKHKIEIKP